MIGTLVKTALVVSLLLTLPTAHAARFKYSCELLKRGSQDAYARAFNASGETIGFNAGPTRWTPAGDRVPLPGIPPAPGADALGINDAGLVVGYSGIYGFPVTPTVWDAVIPKALPLLPGGTKGVAYNVNNAGLITGASSFDGGELMHAVVWDGGGPIDLGTLGAKPVQATRESAVYGMNQAGEMVGFSTANDQGHRHAVYWSPDHEIVDLGTLPGGAESTARHINDAGIIVGSSGLAGSQPDERRPVIWIDKVIRSLPLHPGLDTAGAVAISPSGQIVGATGEPAVINGVKYVGTALLWPDANQTPIDLNTVTKPCKIKPGAFVGQRLVWTVDINASGTILAELQAVPRSGGWYFRVAKLTPLR